METVKIMMADSNGSLRRIVKEYFLKKYDVEWAGDAADGRQALEMVREADPDLMILDAVLPRMDGYAVLEGLSRTGAHTRVLVLTALHSEDAIEHAMSLGASYYMLKPFDLENLYQRCVEIARRSGLMTEYEPDAPEPRSDEEKVTNLFMALGIPAHIKGYLYLREAVRMVMEDQGLINRITKELYPGVAKRHDTTASKVERAMRHAIEVAWNRGRVDNINKLLGCQVFSQNDRPTNGEFIAMVADKAKNM